MVPIMKVAWHGTKLKYCMWEDPIAEELYGKGCSIYSDKDRLLYIVYETSITIYDINT